MTKQTNRLQTNIILFLLIVVVGLTIALVFTLRELKTRPVPEEILPPKPAPPVVGIIALIIDDFGYRNDAVSDGFLALKTPLTFSIIPGHEYSQSFAKEAHAKGHEVIVHMPMETNTPTYGEEEYIVGPSQTSQEIEQRVKKALQLINGSAGMNNHQGSRATADKRVMTIVGGVLKDLGKYFIDSRTTTKTVAETTMRKLGVPTGRRHVFLDNDNDPDLIRLQLDELAEKARQKGVAIGVGHARKNTLKVIQEAIPELEQEGYQFVFVSQVVN
ncbi:MAG: divergent polysaccharide deacetylase family protein [Fidelibacterota bacterium]